MLKLHETKVVCFLEFWQVRFTTRTVLQVQLDRGTVFCREVYSNILLAYHYHFESDHTDQRTTVH